MATRRMDLMERQMRELARRVDRLEGRREEAPKRGPAAPAYREPTVVPPAVAPRPRIQEPGRNQAATPSLSLEELFGGRVLGWLGGIAIFLGIVFFLGMAISRGWIDEPTRVVMAMLGSSALLIAGVWLHERKDRVEVALAAVGSAIAGLFATLITATQLYELIPAEAGLAAAALVGAVAVAIAVRWDSAIVGAIGILGALLAPVMVGAGVSDVSLAFMTVALVSAVAVLLWQRWDWLALGAFTVSAPQMVAWFENGYRDDLAPALAVLGAFWVLYVVAAIGYEVRARDEGLLPVASWILLLANAALVASLGYYALDDTGHASAAVAWILWLSAGHIGFGAFALRQPISREVGSLMVAIGLSLTALGFSDLLDGPALVAGWSVVAVVLAVLATRFSSEPVAHRSSAHRLLAGALVFAGLALGHTLTIEAQPIALIEGVPDLGKALFAVALCAGTAIVFGLLARRVDSAWADAGEFTAAGAMVYLASIAIVDTLGIDSNGEMVQAGQVWLSAFWTLTGLGAVVYGLRVDAKRFRLAGLALLGLAIAKVYTYDLSELDEMARVGSFIGLGLLLLVGAYAYQRIGPALGRRDAEVAR